jgi:hypothetical protein
MLYRLKLIICIFFEPRVARKHGRKDIGGHWKGPKELFLGNKVAKTNSCMLKILMF